MMTTCSSQQHDYYYYYFHVINLIFNKNVFVFITICHKTFMSQTLCKEIFNFMTRHPKKVGTGTRLLLWSISFFNNSLKTFRNWWDRLLELLGGNAVSWSDGGFLLFKSPASSSMGFSFHDASDVFNWEKSGPSTAQINTRALLLRTMLLSWMMSCWNIQGYPWRWRGLDRSICWSKTLSF